MFLVHGVRGGEEQGAPRKPGASGPHHEAIPQPGTLVSATIRLRNPVRLALVALLAVVGVLLIGDRDGLEAEYFALGDPWQGQPRFTTVGEPRLDDVSQVREALLTEVVFSIRWTGWWDVGGAGEHVFALEADDGAYLRIDGELVADSGGVFGPASARGGRALEPGFHAVEVGLHQRHGASRLAIRWRAPGADEEAMHLPPTDLYSARPLALRRLLREALGGWSRPYRQLLGVACVLAALVTLRGSALRSTAVSARLGRWREVFERPGPRAALLLGLFAATFAASLPFTGPLRGGDDTAYLLTATHDLEGWFFLRYGHIYLLKLFVLLAGGEPLGGARLWWSFVFATTVAALALAVRSVGNGLQLRTLAATLFVLLSQAIVVGFVGAPFADYSAMMFVTLAVAVYLHGFVAPQRGSARRHEWHALAIGALSAAAFRSKEVGAILLLLPLFFVLTEGRFAPRRLPRRLLYWAAGGAAVLALSLALDGLVLGDVLFAVSGDRVAWAGGVNFPAGLADRPDHESWLGTIWTADADGVDLSQRFLWLGVLVAAIVAGAQRRRLELRCLHLLPIAYLLALIALYVRMPHVFSVRMLLPILPVAALMAALPLHYAGLDDLPWRRLLAPGLLLLGGVVGTAVLVVLVPFRRGALAAADLLPVAALERYGWSPDHFAVGVLLPAAVLAVVSLVALGAGRPAVRVTALVVLYLTLFGTGFEISRGSLARHYAAQASDLLSYPWRVFAEDLRAAPSGVVMLSNDLKWKYRMSGATEQSLAKLTLGRPDIWVGVTPDFPAAADAAIASPEAYAQWQRRQAPALERALARSARWGPGGFLVLVRPKDAAAEAERLRRLRLSEAELSELHRLLAEIADSRDPAAREHLLERLLGTESLPVRRLYGDRLRAVGLSPAGWTAGSLPTGVIVTNPNDEPLVTALRLAVHAEAAEFPVWVYIDDGEERQTVLFDRRGTRQVELRPVPGRSLRLVVVWSDEEWSAGGAGRQRGLRVLPPAGP